MCAMTAWVEKTHVGAHGPEFDLSLAQRCLVAGRVFWFYLGKLFWPAHLCFVYPRWQPDPSVWWQWLYPATAVGLLLGLWLARNRMGRGPATAAFFYVGTLLPLLGFVSAFAMRYSFVWNHWVYLPSLGPLVLVAALIEGRRKKAEGGKGASDPSPLIPLPSGGRGKESQAKGGRQTIFPLPSSLFYLLPVVLGVLTWHEAGQYADIETLWRSTLARNPVCWMAQTDLAGLLCDQGKPAQAEALYRAALKLNPAYAEARSNLGIALATQGKMTEADQQFQQAVQLNPRYAQGHYNWGIALAREGKSAEAIQEYQRAIELRPNYAEAYDNLGIALAMQGDIAGGMQDFERAVELRPNYAEAQYNLGLGLITQSRWAEAVPYLERAIQLKPDYAIAHFNLATALEHEGKSGDALQHFQRALTLATAQGNVRLAQAARQQLQALQPALQP
jgi:tetratricopeptide (TPR) repeat protein